MVQADGQNLEAIDQELARDEVLDLQGEPEPAKASFDRNLPTTDNTEIDFVDADHPAGAQRNVRISINPLEKNVSVEQHLHSRPRESLLVTAHRNRPRWS